MTIYTLVPRAELEGSSLQCHPSPSPGTAGSEIRGFCSKVALQPSPQGRCSSVVTRANPLPTASHQSLHQQGLWRDLHPAGVSPVPLSAHSAVPTPPCTGRWLLG